MGIQTNDIDYQDLGRRKVFVKHLIDDIRAMDLMLAEGLFEKDVSRIGVEQELCLIDYSLRPMMKNIEVIEEIGDKHFTTELAQFNLEVNLDPREFQGLCFAQIENDLVRMLTKANKVAHKKGGKIILTGILPTIKNSDIHIANITPIQRYQALNEVMTKVRGKDFEFNINGADELIMKSDSVLFESCNTSFQVHFQIDPDHFRQYYNWSQYISGPVMAASANSPIFLGKRLWKETRIALFQQSVDIRKSETTVRDERPRVLFGTDWEKGNIVDHYRENLSRFRVLVSREQESNSLEDLKEGKIPRLGALSLHNGTIYKWNRPCYGIFNGKPHIRIESRYLPSGPTIVDEVANAAFWTGLMNSIPSDMDSLCEQTDFDDVRLNFYKAARNGLAGTFEWRGKKAVPAVKLILKELIPMAEDGLRRARVQESDVEKYMNILYKRCQKEKTGAVWILDSYSKLRKEGSAEECIMAITEGIYQRQKTNKPVHEWTIAAFREAGTWSDKFAKISQVMTRDLITVGEEELIDLVRNIMLWSNIRHVPVENEKGDFVGMISSEILLAYYGSESSSNQEATAGEVMDREPVTAGPENSTVEVIRLMKQWETSCVAIVDKGRLVGLFTERDYIKFSQHLFEEMIVGKSRKNPSK